MCVIYSDKLIGNYHLKTIIVLLPVYQNGKSLDSNIISDSGIFTHQAAG